jgi:hypothetical protein
MRLMLCAPEEQRRDMHAVIAHLLDSHPTPEPQNVDRAMDLLLNTLKLV